MSKLNNMFSEEVQGLLGEDSMKAIEEAYNTRVNESVQAALDTQDAMYAEKLKSLIALIDNDRAKKMLRVVEAVQKQNASKLLKVANGYKRAINRDGVKFKRGIIESVSDFMDEYINEAIPVEDFKVAMKNKAAFNVLDNLRGVLAVDIPLMKESVKGAITEGYSKIGSLESELSQYKKNFKALYETHEKAKIEMTLENKLRKLPELKKQFIKKTFADKPLEYIEENFEYVSKLYDRQEVKNLTILKEDAINSRKNKPDFIQTKKVVTEKLNTIDPMDELVETLTRFKK